MTAYRAWMRLLGSSRLGKKLPARSLGNLQLHVAGLGGQKAPPVPVALGLAGLGALVAPGADHLGRLGLDQFLEHQAHRLADQIEAVTSTEHLEQLGQDRIIKGHRCSLLWVRSLAEHTEDYADGSPSGGPFSSPKAHH